MFNNFLPASLPVIVKNTFLDLDEPSPLQRRSASMPPRLRERTKSKCVDEWEGSTEASDDDTSTLTDLTRRPLATVSQSALNPLAPAWHPALNTVPTQQSTHQLNSKAKAWVPSASFELLAYRQQFSAVVAAVKETLSYSDHVLDVQATDGTQDWSLVLKVRVEDFPYTAKVLRTAQDELLRAAEQSHCVYIMGYCTKPFEQTASGFVATFGAMADESSACWDIFSKGFCRRQGQGECRWQHPMCTAVVEVKVEHCHG